MLGEGVAGDIQLKSGVSWTSSATPSLVLSTVWPFKRHVQFLRTNQLRQFFGALDRDRISLVQLHASMTNCLMPGSVNFGMCVLTNSVFQ